MPRRTSLPPQVLVVEDDEEWRDELVMMYCRIIRGVSRRQSAPDACHSCTRAEACIGYQPENAVDDNLHDCIDYEHGGREAIRFLTKKSNAKQKVDILSLDINLFRQAGKRRQDGELGLDVLDAAVTAGRRIAVLAITGCLGDTVFPEMLNEKERQQIAALNDELRKRSGGECEVFAKMPVESYGSVQKQVRNIESRLSRKRLADMVKKTQEAVTDLDGKYLCLHFVLPDADFGNLSDRWLFGIPHLFNKLNQIETWHSVFHDMEDADDARDQLPARLMYLVKPCKFLQWASVQDDPSKPIGINEWFDLAGKLTPAQMLLLIRLIAKRAQGDANPRRASYDHDAEGNIVVVSRDDVDDSALRVCGLRNPSEIPWESQSITDKGRDATDLTITTQGADKKNSSELHANLRQLLDVNYDLIVSKGGSYSLQVDGHVFIHRESSLQRGV